MDKAARKGRRAGLVFALVIGVLGAGLPLGYSGPDRESKTPKETHAMQQTREADPTQAQRQAMVKRQIERRGISDARVLEAMREVPRHRFVPKAYANTAYTDGPLPIGHGQTISQPYIVAFMTEALEPQPGDKVLEIGTGCGYQAAVLSGLVEHIYTIEIVEPLAASAKKRLTELGYKNITVRAGDGYLGWPDEAPFDKIIVTAAPPRIPQALIDQLKPGGLMILPVGESFQKLQLVTKDNKGKVKVKSVLPVRFVPMVHGNTP